jgi:hypothetical protein
MLPSTLSSHNFIICPVSTFHEMFPLISVTWLRLSQFSGLLVDPDHGSTMFCEMLVGFHHSACCCIPDDRTLPCRVFSAYSSRSNIHLAYCNSGLSEEMTTKILNTVTCTGTKIRIQKLPNKRLRQYIISTNVCHYTISLVLYRAYTRSGSVNPSTNAT